jgi:excisionase family DNA binding protein
MTMGSGSESDEIRPDSGIAPRLMTVAEAARYMGVAEGTVRRMVAGDKLPIVRIGRATRIDRLKLDKLLDGGVLETGD